MINTIICATSLIFAAVTLTPTQEEVEVARQSYFVDFQKLFTTWAVSYGDLAKELDNPFDADVVCDKDHLLSSRQKWADSELFAVRYKQEYLTHSQRLLNKFLDVFRDPQERAQVLQEFLENDRADPLIKELLDVEILVAQKVISLIDFFLARHGKYAVKDGQILFSTSTEDVKALQSYFQELADLRTEELRILAFFSPEPS